MKFSWMGTWTGSSEIVWNPSTHEHGNASASCGRACYPISRLSARSAGCPGTRLVPDQDSQHRTPRVRLLDPKRSAEERFDPYMHMNAWLSVLCVEKTVTVFTANRRAESGQRLAEEWVGNTMFFVGCSNAR